jgi:hypothetical protein
LSERDTVDRALQGDPDAALELLTGRPRDLEPLLAEHTATEAQTLSGWLCFLRGDYAGAIARFDDAHQAERKRTRKRNLYLTGLPGALYLLALLRRGEADDFAKVQQQVGVCLRASVSDKIELAYRVIGDLATVMAGQRKSEECYALHYALGPQRPLPLLIQTLALHWLDKRRDAGALPTLARHAKDAAASGER